MTAPTEKLCEHELQLLRECAGLDKPRPWGAAVGAGIEVLMGRGLIASGKPTEAGWHALLRAERAYERAHIVEALRRHASGARTMAKASPILGEELRSNADVMEDVADEIEDGTL